jgi:hypothetical protein
MGKETKIKCDKCKKEIKEGYDQRYMIIVSIGYAYQYNDGGSFPAVDRKQEKKYLHFDCSKPMFKACPELVPEALS